MGRIGLRIAGLGALVALTSLAAAAVGQTPPPAEPRKDKKELREDRKEIREDRKELRDAAKAGDKEAAKDAREELKEDKKELREDQKAKLEELRKTRQDRRKDRVKEIRDKWGDAANKPNARAEIRTHARRMARLNHAKTLATSAGKAEIVARIDKLIERENTRHQAAMERLKAEGGKP